MAQELRGTGLETQVGFPRPTWQLTTISNSNNLFWPPQALQTCGQMYMYAKDPYT